MLYYACDELSADASQHLSNLQRQIDELPTHALRYAEATRLFASKTSRAFQEVREKLASASPPGEACFYCERDRYRDIDHIRPKRHYPEECFAWKNYVYACAICNQDAKRDTYAVFLPGDDSITEFDRSLPLDAPIPAGDPVLLDPREEDPLDFLQLDLETGRFVSIGDARGRIRGEFTVSLLGLNESSLAKIRVHAYRSFKMYLEEHFVAMEEGNREKAALAIEEIKSLHCPTVLVEMRRQADLIPELAALFAVLPLDVGDRPRPVLQS